MDGKLAPFNNMKEPYRYVQPSVSKDLLTPLNQLFEIEKKLSASPSSDPSSCLRQVEKMKAALEELLNLFYEDPTGQAYKETRTDLEATIAGAGTEDLEVVEVIKPIIRQGNRELSSIVQKAIVVVESKSPNKEH